MTDNEHQDDRPTGVPAEPAESPQEHTPAQAPEPQQPEPSEGQSAQPGEGQYPPPTYDQSAPQQPQAFGPGAPQPPAPPQYGYWQYDQSAYGQAPSYGPPYEQAHTQSYEPVPPSAGPFGPYATPEQHAEPKRKSARPARTTLVAAVLAALIGAGIGAGTVAAFGNHNTTVDTGLSTTSANAPGTAKIDGTISAAAAKIQPSVVTINVSGQQESGTGSGVIIRSDGYILTNAHVVNVASGGTIQVVLDNGTTANAHVVGVDTPDDLAVVKINKSGLTAATFSSSSKLIVGQTVVAVGAPLGLSDTVTSGIVSNTARPVASGDNSGNSEAVFDAIQTDAAINPGNSGGPLVDLNGNVVGINAAIASTGSGGLQVPGSQAGNIGIGFAIPSDEASRIASELIATGKATHALLGVSNSGNNGNSQSGRSTTGAVVGTVTPGSPADKAGIRTGDVITKVDKQLIGAWTDLVAAVRSHAPNSKVTITFTHDGTTKTVDVTLGSSTK